MQSARGRISRSDFVCAALFVLAACDPKSPAPTESKPLESPAPAAPQRREPEASVRPTGFLKGQLHMHTGNSGDSDTPPKVAVRWYADHGFDFVVVTDHNVVTVTEGQRGMLVLTGIELTQNLRHCEPAPLPRLACLLHTTGLFVEPSLGRIAFPRAEDAPREEVYQHEIDKALGAGGIAMLNHPNFQYAADTDLIVSLASHGLTMLEVANEAVDSNNLGDAQHPSTEAIWDAALTRGARLWGTATDDAHNYDDADAVTARGETAYVGNRGFVMVRSEKNPRAIRAAIEKGDFYGSTGLLFEDFAQGRTAIHLTTHDDVTFDVVGTGGVVLQSSRGRSMDFDVTKAKPGYVRARARDEHGHIAFTQPVFIP